METVDAFSSTTTVAGFLGIVAGIGAVCAYGYTQRGPLTRQLFGGASAEHGSTRVIDGVGVQGEGEKGAESVVPGESRKGRRRRRRGKGKGVVTGVGGGEDEGEGGDGGQTQGKADEQGPETIVIPGDFDGTSAGAHVGSRAASPTVAAGTVLKAGNGGKTRKRKKRNQGRGRGKDNDKDAENKEAEDEEDEDKEASSEAGKEPGIVGGRTAPAAAYRVRSGGDSTDASVSIPPSVVGTTSDSSRSVAGKGHLRGNTSRLDMTLSRPQIHARSSLSFDTDSSWTHVDHHHRRIKASMSTDGQDRIGMDTMDMTSSDLGSTASDSPVAERADNITDIRGDREDLPQHALAKTLAPRPSKTGVDDMVEEPDFSTRARVIRVQPPANEAPVAGFSWDDYGDVVEDSLLVHDADQEDEGEWGIVKSRSRTRPQQQTTTATPSTSHDAAAAETMTKKQRQNARKRELAKAVKAETEAARLQGLAKHKRELERFQIIEQSRQGGGKRPGGGMQASVDDRGKLVWE